MTRDEAISRLRQHQEELRAVGVRSVSLFGSVARGEQNAESDVDLAVRLDAGFSKPGLEYFGRFEELQQRIEQLLGCAVDLVEEPVEKPRVQLEIERDRVLAF